MMRTGFRLLFYSMVLFALALLLGYREYASPFAIILFALFVGYGLKSFLKMYSRFKDQQSKTSKKR